jgi:hypothetical protein
LIGKARAKTFWLLAVYMIKGFSRNIPNVIAIHTEYLKISLTNDEFLLKREL